MGGYKFLSFCNKILLNCYRYEHEDTLHFDSSSQCSLSSCILFLGNMNSQIWFDRFNFMIKKVMKLYPIDPTSTRIFSIINWPDFLPWESTRVVCKKLVPHV